jgi:DNA-binding response OmpR family regulator
VARLLLAEDDPDIREAVCALLADDGHEVECVDAVSSARTSFDRRRPDVAILDLDLHGESSQVLIEAWTGVVAPPQIVIISASPKQARDIGLRYGLLVVTKPFGVTELVAAIAMALRHSRAPAVS